MPIDFLNDRDFGPELTFTASRSSGPGGQNVNKLSTKVELRFNILQSSLLSEEEKAIILEKLSTKINSNGELIIVSQSERSQLQNKEKTLERFYVILAKALMPVKKRKPTRLPRAAREKRLEEKRLTGEKKERRKKL
jgi:ribosome-associated protein